MKVAVGQLAPGEDLSRNVDGAVSAIRQAAAEGAELVVLPEMCISPYQLGEEPLEPWAVEIPAGQPVQCWLRETKAHGCFLVAGVLERDGDRYYNSAVVLGPQGLLAHYRKAHLFGWERRRLSPGSQEFHPVDTGKARLGVLICYDLRFAEAVRLLVLQKAQLLCVPTAWTNIGKKQPWDRWGLCAAAHMALGYSYANRVFLLCAARVGEEKGVLYLGNSLIAGPGGELLAGPAGPGETTVLVAETDPRQADDKRVGEDNDLLADRRTDLYTIKGLRGATGTN